MSERIIPQEEAEIDFNKWLRETDEYDKIIAEHVERRMRWMKERGYKVVLNLPRIDYRAPVDEPTNS